MNKYYAIVKSMNEIGNWVELGAETERQAKVQASKMLSGYGSDHWLKLALCRSIEEANSSSNKWIKQYGAWTETL